MLYIAGLKVTIMEISENFFIIFKKYMQQSRNSYAELFKNRYN